MAVISNPSGSGKSGVVGIPLLPLLQKDAHSGASWLRIARVSPKSYMSHCRVGIDM